MRFAIRKGQQPGPDNFDAMTSLTMNALEKWFAILWSQNAIRMIGESREDGYVMARIDPVVREF
jgi:hypothetical protein